MNDVLADLSFLISRKASSVRELYDRAATRYDHFRDLWLGVAGSQTERAMLDAIRTVIRPTSSILDAGAGTGALSARIHEMESTARITMLDLSDGMLRRAPADLGGRVQASVLELPFPDGSFDLVVSGWVIETIDDPPSAVREFLRVLAPEGYLFYTFCSLPEGWFSRAGSSFLRSAVKKGFAGEFLERADQPWHDCPESRIARFHGGLSTLVVLRKCCNVDTGVLPPAGNARFSGPR